MKEPDLSVLPDALAVRVADHWQAFVDAGGVLPDGLMDELPRVWAGSDYVAEQMSRHPALADFLAMPAALGQPLSPTAWRDEVAGALAGMADFSALEKALRSLRQRQMCRIIWRDLSGRADYATTVADLSLMADQLLDAALHILWQWACNDYGTPLDAQGKPLQMTVFAMGKLGAEELNLSSDIDLIFAYEQKGTIDSNGKLTGPQPFFVQLGQRLIQLLNKTTAEGFVFRVDMRLRPWGKSGPVAISFDAMESYYETHGREWERYALIKMRPVAGDIAAGQRFMGRLTPFVYRRYLDFGAFQHLRDMKALIEREVNRNGSWDDIKLGAGGIREIEFIVQAFQLIRGGQIAELQEPNLLQALSLLSKHGLLPDNVVSELREAYIFLRNVEHCLQAQGDRQTQRLPDDSAGWERLAYSMEHLSSAGFERQLEQYRDQVRLHFSRVVADSGREAAEASATSLELSAYWQGRLSKPDADALLASMGMPDADDIHEALAAFRESREVAGMQALARGRLDKLMPGLLEIMSYQGLGITALRRLLVFLEAIVRRSAYISLLVENPLALTQLVKLTAASSFIAERLTLYPVLLDELLDVRALYRPPSRQELVDELHQHLLRLPEDDLEQQMETLRTFKQAHLLRVAACEVTETLPLMKVSDYLTWLAEAILEQVVQLAWDDMVAKYGRPLRDNGDAQEVAEFIVVGYGKLGSIELGHLSDLDLVFLHDSDIEGQTDGGKSLPNEQFFARLSQRITHILTTRTLSGPLYKVDMRLRPSGVSGLLVTSLSAFKRYQNEQAWVWEQQALVRARPVAGDTRLADKFSRLRQTLLCQPRDKEALKRAVMDMRERMLASRHSPEKETFHLKQDAGGIVDIEFMVQYSVLLWAHRHPELAAFTDNVRLLETLAAHHLVATGDAGLLREAYLAFRSAAHISSLANESDCVAAGRFRELRQGVLEVWKRWFESD